MLQRFYRKWKFAKQKSTEDNEPVDIHGPADWNAPFRLMEQHFQDIRSGKNKKREKVNMAAHRKEMILAGLASQEFENRERDVSIARGWQKVISGASKDITSGNDYSHSQ